jgi:hypothetical protein
MPYLIGAQAMQGRKLLARQQEVDGGGRDAHPLVLKKATPQQSLAGAIDLSIVTPFGMRLQA